MKLNIFILLLVGIFTGSNHLFAQQHPNTPFFPGCGTDQMHNTKNNDYNTLTKKYESELYYKILSDPNPDDQTPYTIPVVFHIIHNNGSENISDARVQAVLADLNKAFGARSPYKGMNIDIQFCLAKQTPDGQLSNGINRVASTLTSMDMNTQDLAVKNLIRWDPTKYMNVWIVRDICAGSNCSVAGYAYLAGAHGQNMDGIVVESEWIGTSSAASMVLIHEVGHYLNLYHTFNQGCNNDNCMADGDKVCDTPPDNSTYGISPCTAFENSCTTDSDDHSTNNPFRPVGLGGIGDQHDYNDNFMDYGSMECQNSFTFGQRSRMRSSLLVIRSSLLQSNGCQTPCPTSITASFTLPTNPNVGAALVFTNTSTNAADYVWQINNVTVANTTNLTHSFATPGVYTIRLKATNGALCEDLIEKHITITCISKAQFTLASSSILKGNSISVTDASTNNTSREWFVNGVFASNSTTLNQTFANAGNYSIMLVAHTALCSDTLIKALSVVDNCPVNASHIFDNWYFGKEAGISFKSGTAVALTNGKINQREGCASISDTNGDILFYTDGVTVYNKQHAVMTNGGGLLGNYSSTQSAIIIPMPGSAIKYYIITCDYGAGVNGIRYNVVDMSLSSGLGAIVTTQKNILLYQNNSGTAEKLISTRHSDGVNYWLIYHETGSAKFRSHLVNSSGIQTAIVSTVGSVLNSYDWETTGYLKFSPDSKLLANPIGSGLRRVELFDFNTSTGTLTNPKVIALQDPYIFCYGVEFSPDGNLLYVSTMNRDYDPISSTGSILQYDLTAGDYTAITNSRVVLKTSSQYSYGALQIAPDGKIYSCKENGFNGGTAALGTISAPNAKGVSCLYTEDAFSLSGKLALIGLPTFINTASVIEPPLSFNESLSCSSTTVQFTPSIANKNGYEWSWDFGDSQTNKSYTPSHTYASAGEYTITLTLKNICFGTLTATKKITVYDPLDPAIADMFLCNSTPILITKDLGNITYKWSTGASVNNITVAAAGKYWLEVTRGNCIVADTFNVVVIPIITPFTIKDTLICGGNTYNVTVSQTNSIHLLWPDGTSEKTYSAYYSGKHWLRKYNECSTVTDTFLVTFKAVPLISFTTLDSIVCFNILKETDLIPNISGGTFTGAGITGTHFSTKNLPVGTHVISYTYEDPNGCKATSNQEIIIAENTEQPDIVHETICQSSYPKTVKTSKTGKKYLWNTNDISKTISIPQEGIYWVDVTFTNNCTIRDSFIIATEKDIQLTIKDTTICNYDTLKFVLPPAYSYTIIPSSIVHVPGEYTLTATNKCYSKSYDFTLLHYPAPSFVFENNSICAGDSITPLLVSPTGGVFTGRGVLYGQLFNPMLSRIGHTEVMYHYTDSYNCHYSPVHSIAITSCIDIPNLITPNDDGKNDFLVIKGLAPGYTLEVVNRWGDLVYLNHTYANNWNPSNISDGIYYYRLYYTDNQDIEYKGWIQVIK